MDDRRSSGSSWAQCRHGLGGSGREPDRVGGCGFGRDQEEQAGQMNIAPGQDRKGAFQTRAEGLRWQLVAGIVFWLGIIAAVTLWQTSPGRVAQRKADEAARLQADYRAAIRKAAAAEIEVERLQKEASAK